MRMEINKKSRVSPATVKAIVLAGLIALSIILYCLV